MWAVYKNDNEEANMRAIKLTQFGSPEVLMMGEASKPIPGPEELLVRVKATALNRADLLQRRGKYPPPPNESSILGLEIAGIVEACGNQVTHYAPGDRVFGLVGGGAYAEYCVIDHKIAMPIPANLSFIEAAAIPEAFLTANEALMTLGELNSNETVLIHAGGSGVGSASIQLAKAFNTTVYSTTSTLTKIEKIKKLGADYVFNIKDVSFLETLQKTRTIDVILDFLGASLFQQHLSILKSGGRLICIGLLEGDTATISLDKILSHRLQIKGLIMRMRSREDKRAITERFTKRWLPLFATNKLYPVIDSVYPLEEVITAHEHMEKHANFGKIILTID